LTVVRIWRVERRGWGGETGDLILQATEPLMKRLLGWLPVMGLVDCGAEPAVQAVTVEPGPAR